MLSLVPPRRAGITTSSQALEQQKRFALADLLRGTETMLESARQGDWSAVETMERERKADLVDYFRRNDQEIGKLWDLVQQDPVLKDTTTLLVCPEFGRDKDLNERNGLDHGDGSDELTSLSSEAEVAGDIEAVPRADLVLW